MLQAFQQLDVQLSQSIAVKDSVHNVLKDIDGSLRTIRPKLYKLFRIPQLQHESENVELDNLLKEFASLETHWIALDDVLSSTDLKSKYYSMTRSIFQEISHSIAFVFWMQNRTLIEKSLVEQAAGLSGYFEIDVEDFLIGICGLSKDLCRVVVNAVSRGEYSVAIEVHSFLEELFGAFQTLNLRNDILRKRYDGIKYDIQTVEQIVYDLRIRGLVDE